MKYLLYLTITLLGILVTLPVLAEPPQVSNVNINQRNDGSFIVDVIYDVSDAEGDELAITLQLSVNGGESWDFPTFFAEGDVGPGIVPGQQKQIICDFSQVDYAIGTGSIQARVIASDLGTLFEPHSPRHVVITQLGPLDWSDQSIIEKFSRADLLIMTASDIWTGSDYGDIPVVDQLKALNPDLKIVGYVSGFSAKLYAENSDPDFFWYKWFHRTRPYWVYTTQGDTAQTWPGNAVIDITNPDCRQVMIETVVEFQEASLNKMDGIYWDYFNNSLWVYPELDVDGEIDIDEDGIGHNQDQDEMEAYRAAQVALVGALRDTLGEGFLQIFNGQRAYGDEEFAGLADGVMYELSPTLFFPEPDMQHALDPNYSKNLFNVRGWLRDVNGGPYVIMSNVWRSVFWDHNQSPTVILTGNQYRAVGLIMGGYSSWNSHDGSTFSYTYGWTNTDITLGQPLGPPVFEGEFIRRDFEYGRVEIEMQSGDYPNPFDYRIWALGQLVEELSIPFHYP